jgi:hypothetical protein
MTRVDAGFSVKSAENAYKGAEASRIPQNPTVAINKPNGHGLAQQMEVK